MPGCDPMVGDFLVDEAERSDLEGQNLGLMRRSFVMAFMAAESTVSLLCISSWLGVQIKIMYYAKETSKVWMRAIMGWSRGYSMLWSG